MGRELRAPGVVAVHGGKNRVRDHHHGSHRGKRSRQVWRIQGKGSADLPWSRAGRRYLEALPRGRGRADWQHYHELALRLQHVEPGVAVDDVNQSAGIDVDVVAWGAPVPA